MKDKTYNIEQTKAKIDLSTSLLLLEDFVSLVATSGVTAYVKGYLQNEDEMEIYMRH